MDLLAPTHILLILVVALLVLGPKRLPEVGRALGRGLRDFRDAMSGYSPDNLMRADEPPVTAAEAAESELHREPPATAGAVQSAPPRSAAHADAQNAGTGGPGAGAAGSDVAHGTPTAVLSEHPEAAHSAPTAEPVDAEVVPNGHTERSAD